MRAADKADAIWVAVQRTGDVWLGDRRVRSLDQLLSGIRERIREGSENKVYISADARAKYGWVREVLEAVQSSATERVALLVYKRDRPYPEP